MRMPPFVPHRGRTISNSSLKSPEGSKTDVFRISSVSMETKENVKI